MRRRLSEGGRSNAHRCSGNAAYKRRRELGIVTPRVDAVADDLEYRRRYAYAERMAAMKARLLGDLGLSRVARAREDDAR